MTDPFPLAIQELLEGAHRHPALDNEFYQHWMSQALGAAELEIFARNYLGRISQTPTVIALTILGVPDSEIRARISGTLFTELGCGEPDRAHLRLLEHYLLDLLSRRAGRTVTLGELLREPLLACTEEFSSAQRALYTSEHPCRILGAHLAQEWLAYPMLARLYEGARLYMPMYPSIESFHEHAEYFHAHIGATEKTHRREVLLAAGRLCRTPQDWAELTASIERVLHITADYWAGMFRALRASAARRSQASTDQLPGPHKATEAISEPQM